MITFCSATARPFSMRVDSEVISIGTSLKLPNWARAPDTNIKESASKRSSRFMRGGEAIGRLGSLPSEKAGTLPEDGATRRRFCASPPQVEDQLVELVGK